MSESKSELLWRGKPIHKLKKAELLQALETIQAEHIGDELETIGLTRVSLQPRLSIPQSMWTKAMAELFTDANRKMEALTQMYLTEWPTSANTCASGAGSEPHGSKS